VAQEEVDVDGLNGDRRRRGEEEERETDPTDSKFPFNPYTSLPRQRHEGRIIIILIISSLRGG
jgi:hypothetical protein